MINISERRAKRLPSPKMVATYKEQTIYNDVKSTHTHRKTAHASDFRGDSTKCITFRIY